MIGIAVTDAILVVGHRYDIKNDQYDSSLMKEFLLEKGTAIELELYSPIETDKIREDKIKAGYLVGLIDEELC